MPTPLKRTVYRVCERPHDHRGRRLVAGLEPGDLLSLREERARSALRVPLSEIWAYLLRREFLVKQRQKKGRKSPRP